MIIRLAIAVALSINLGPAHALNTEISRNIISFGATFGGDSLGSVNLAETDAGDGVFSSYYGRAFPLSKNIHGQLNIGFKENKVGEDDNKIYFYRFPLDAIAFSQFGKIRIGVGATYHLNPTYKTKTNGSSNEEDFNNAFGTLIQADFFTTQHMSFGLRYEGIEYEPGRPLTHTATGITQTVFDATNFGIYMSAHF